jgi:hypothetical protein
MLRLKKIAKECSYNGDGIVWELHGVLKAMLIARHEGMEEAFERSKNVLRGDVVRK